MIQILDQYLCGKLGIPELCEDAIVINENFLAVIDGVTSTHSHLYDGLTGGRIACNLIGELLESIPERSTIDDFLACSADRFSDEYRLHEILESAKYDAMSRFSATAAIYSVARREVWLIGDVGCLINNDVVQFHRPLDEALAFVRSCLLQMELNSGRSVQELREDDLARRMLIPIHQAIHRSRTAGYDERFSVGVIDGFPIDERCIRIYTLRHGRSQSEIVLATDGYPRIETSLKKSEEVLEQLLRHDLLCINELQGTKGVPPDGASFDDRAYLRFTVNS